MIGLVFPGQGSQRPGMGRSFVDDDSWEMVDQAQAVLGLDVAHLLLDADATELRDTRCAQLAVFITSVMLARALMSGGVRIGAIAGHSVGEYAALVAAGALTYADALGIVTCRADGMARACRVTPGSMVALGASESATRHLLDDHISGGAWVAAVNGLRQTVVGGTDEGIEALRAAARAQRIACRPLDVGGAFHTPLMASAAEALRPRLASQEFATPAPLCVANLDGRVHRGGGEWRELLVGSLTRPVRWSETITTMTSLGVESFLELGPGALKGAVRGAAPGAAVAAAGTFDELERWLTEYSHGPAGTSVLRTDGLPA